MTKRNLIAAAVLLALSGTFALVAWLWIPYRLIVGFGSILAFVQMPWFLFRAINASSGDLGESRAIKVLQTLDDRYTLVTNWVPVEGKGDVDLLLLGPHGVLVIEVKNYSVPVKCEGDNWFIRRDNGSWRPIKSVSKQLSTNVRRVSKKLNCPATGVIVFNDGVNLEQSTCPVKVIRRKELLSFVACLPPSIIDTMHIRQLCL